MTDELGQASPQQEIPPAPQVSTPLPVQPKKSKKKIWMIVGIVLSVLCLCSIACVAIFGSGMYKVKMEKAPVESVLDDYMRYMANKDAGSAYALFSPRAQRQVPITKINEMLEGNNYFLFTGYKSLSASNLNISETVNTNPDLPQGTVAKVTGIIKFEGGFQGSFSGILEKVDGRWMIDYIYVSVPPDKIQQP